MDGSSYIVSTWKTLDWEKPCSNNKESSHAKGTVKSSKKTYTIADKHKQRTKRPKLICAPDSEYVQKAAEDVISESDRENLREEILDEMKCIKLERATIGQHDNPLWTEVH
ncbi:hypothetical protein PR048_005345 [Dryococelus australis]|uniref:Uncharacterized protein n=1 Tax=Dryococelus australis TaxID=614101 RepID=A0ABQ9I8Z7_9NEOP|nr:hypothetical protein PR048_005345 [Dryococelus australis]